MDPIIDAELSETLQLGTKEVILQT